MSTRTVETLITPGSSFGEHAIRTVFARGVEWGDISAETWHSLKSVQALSPGRSDAKESDPVKSVPDADIEAVLNEVPPTVQAMIRLQRLTGMRPGELVIMRGCDIDRTDRVWVYRPMEYKTEHFDEIGKEHGREIPLGPRAQAILGEFLDRAPSAFLFDPRRAMKERYALCRIHRRKPNPKRKTTRKLSDRYTTNSYAQAIARACKKAGVTHWSPNRLRHNTADDIEDKYGLGGAQSILGHRSRKTTEIYLSRQNR